MKAPKILIYDTYRKGIFTGKIPVWTTCVWNIYIRRNIRHISAQPNDGGSSEGARETVYMRENPIQ